MDKESKNEECTMVSIIMPVYNAAEFLKDSVGDILAQTYEDFELICVDDGSTDDSGMILDGYAVRDSRVHVIHQTNRGGGAARNNGMDMARGKYLIFLDADDRFELNLLECIVGVAETGDIEVLTFGGDTFDHITGESSPAPWLIKRKDKPAIDDPFDVLNTTVWNKIFLRSHIYDNGIRFQTYKTVNTMYFTFLAVVYAQRLETVPQVLVHYRVNNRYSAMSGSDQYPLEVVDAFNDLKEKLLSDGKLEQKRHIYLRCAGEYIRDRLLRLNTEQSFSALYNALHNDGIEKLEINDNTIFREIKEKEVCGFLYDNRKKMTSYGLTGPICWLLPIDIKETGLRIAIYGGGDVGKDFFMQVMRRSGLTLSCWVDRNWEKIGYPLQSPEILKEKDYDIVLIAVADKRVADSIKGSLIDMGIPEDKIVWDEYTQII